MCSGKSTRSAKSTTRSTSNSKSATAVAIEERAPAEDADDEGIPPIVIKASPPTETAKSVLSLISSPSELSESAVAELVVADDAADADGDDEEHNEEEPILKTAPSTEDEIAATQWLKWAQSTESNKSLVKAAPVDHADKPIAVEAVAPLKDNDDKSVVSTKSGHSIKSFFSSKLNKLTKKSGAEVTAVVNDEPMDHDNKSVASNKSARSFKSIKSLLSFKSARSNKSLRSSTNSVPMDFIETVTSADSTKSALSTRSVLSEGPATPVDEITASPSTDTASKMAKTTTSSKPIHSAIARDPAARVTLVHSATFPASSSGGKQVDEQGVATPLHTKAETRHLLKRYGFKAGMHKYSRSVAKVAHPKKGTTLLPSLVEEKLLDMKETKPVAAAGMSIEGTPFLPTMRTSTVLSTEEVSSELAVGFSTVQEDLQEDVVETIPPPGFSPSNLTMSKSESSEVFGSRSVLDKPVQSQKGNKGAAGLKSSFNKKGPVELVQAKLLEDGTVLSTEKVSGEQAV